MTGEITLRYRSRKQFTRTNAPGTCLYCGRKLRKHRYSNERGDYADNAFCGLGCGYSFGVIAAKNNFRLEPYTGGD